MKAVHAIGGNPADADTDTLAWDISYTTDAFDAVDVEINAQAATEYNDTDNTLALVAATPQEQTLTAANVDAQGNIKVPAGGMIRTTITWAGSPADGRVTLAITGVFV